jgi:hypothetical protein
MEATLTSRFMTIKQWVEAFGYIPEGGLRHLIFQNKDFENRVVRRLGRKILLDVAALEEFIAEQGSNTQAITKPNKSVA